MDLLEPFRICKWKFCYYGHLRSCSSLVTSNDYLLCSQSLQVRNLGKARQRQLGWASCWPQWDDSETQGLTSLDGSFLYVLGGGCWLGGLSSSPYGCVRGAPAALVWASLQLRAGFRG